MTQISAKEGIIALGFSLMFIVFLSGCTTYPSGNNTTIVTGPNTITIQNFSFSPSVLVINVSQKVTWINQDSVPHQIASSEGLFDSATLSTGATYTFRFDTPGNYTYHCSIHPFMAGEIVVLGPEQPANETNNQTNATQPGQNETNATTPAVNNTNQTTPAVNETNQTTPVVNNTMPNTVIIQNSSFMPQKIAITTGQKVTWINEDAAYQSVVADNGTFESEILATGENYTFEFDTPGNYTYHCGIHPTMTGEVDVYGSAQATNNTNATANQTANNTNQTTPVVNNTNQTTPTTGAARMAIIDINDSTFIPQTVTVYVGGIVDWRNNDNFTHNLKSAIFAHNMSKGDSYVYQFDVPGTVVFWDDLMPSLKGTVMVVTSSGQTGSTNVTTPPTNQTNATIQLNATTIGIYSTGFKPDVLSVEGGSKVTWLNLDSVVHKVMSRTFQSIAIPPGGSFTRTFDKSGSFVYWDSENQLGMGSGQIIVN